MAQNIERRTGLSVTEFVDQYLVANKPVIVTDAMKTWSLFRTPAELSERFGGELVQVYNDLFDLQNVVPLRTYLDQWFGKDVELDATKPLPYVRWYTKMKDIDFAWADTAFCSFADQWALPYFLPSSDYLLPCAGSSRKLNPARDPFPAKGLFISPKGASTRLHHDPWASDAVLCQLFGEKHFALHSPEKRSSDGSGVKECDFEATLIPGEVIFIPRGWPHRAQGRTDSISLTWNFVHSSTWKWFFQHLASPPPANELPVLRYFANLKEH
jgi:hypothetical protein